MPKPRLTTPRLGRGIGGLALATTLLSACASLDSGPGLAAGGNPTTTPVVGSITDAAPPLSSQQSAPPATTNETVAKPAPAWLGSRVLPTTPDGKVPPQTTPVELHDRKLATNDTLPPPSLDQFESSISELDGDPLARSTWHPGCPVGVDELRYVQVVFWGFDERSHTGELIAHRDVAEDLVEVMRSLYEARYPIEEMRIVTPEDLNAEPTGDGNNTTVFVCRAVTNGTRFSEHAYGLAIDINPFLNPYIRDGVVLPELAAAYLDRDRSAKGMVADGDLVVKAFQQIGWGWGGHWSSLKDYQHFALHNR